MKSFTHIRQRSRSNIGTGVFLATTAAALFATAPVAQAAPQEVVIHCTGVNACKGQGRCGTAEHSCKGANACKGQGILPMSQKECAAQGGKPKDIHTPKT